jgi:glycosyltransferase involved in cell wall biosynthesis
VELAEAFPPDHVRSDFLVLTGLDGVLDDRVRAAGGEVIKCPLNAHFPRAFYRLLRTRRYDVVHSHVHYFSGVILMLARLAGIPVRIAHLHTAVVNDREDTRRRRAQLAICRKLVDRNATDIVAVGEGTMIGAWREGWSADPRCRIIYSGIRSERLHSLPLRSTEPTLVNVATIKPLKNQLRLIRMFRRVVDRIPEARLQLIGRESGEYGQAVRQAVADAGLANRVHLVGEVDEPLPWIAGARVMVLPSLWEGLPCAVLEACAAGTPVVASDLPGTREVARYFSDIQVLSLDADDDIWCSAIVRLLDARSSAAVAAAVSLARSPFGFAHSVQAHLELWSRSHAAA